MSSSSVPSPNLTDAGYVVPAESALLVGAQADINAAFGGGLSANLETPQGQLASSLSALAGDYGGQLALLLNSFDPSRASGRAQDALGRIYFLERQPDRPTIVQVVCTGAVGTVIPAGAMVTDGAGVLYAAQVGGTIGGGGTITLAFAAAVAGPTPCPPGSISRIYRAIPGWDSVTNTVEGVLGAVTENRVDFERRRADSVTINSLGPYAAVRAELLNTAGVIDAYVTGNNGSSALTVSGVSLPAHSMYASVAGGLPADVGRAIFTKKAPGCDMSGNTTVTVVDTAAQIQPGPSYSITYQVATPTPIKVAVTLANSLSVPADATAQVQQAILAAFAGADGGPRARIGAITLASRYYAGISALGTWVELLSVFVGTATPATATSLTLTIDRVPTMSAADITVSLV